VRSRPVPRCAGRLCPYVARFLRARRAFARHPDGQTGTVTMIPTLREWPPTQHSLPHAPAASSSLPTTRPRPTRSLKPRPSSAARPLTTTPPRRRIPGGSGRPPRPGLPVNPAADPQRALRGGEGKGRHRDRPLPPAEGALVVPTRSSDEPGWRHLSARRFRQSTNQIQPTFSSGQPLSHASGGVSPLHGTGAAPEAERTLTSIHSDTLITWAPAASL
jgi:hypothetical protein